MILLWNYTSYSHLASLTTVQALVDFAVKRKLPAIAITDRESCAGFIEFTRICNKNNIHPIYGAEYYFNEDLPVVLLVKSQVGYESLVKLNNLYHKRKAEKIGYMLSEHFYDLNGLILIASAEFFSLSNSAVYTATFDHYQSIDIREDMQRYKIYAPLVAAAKCTILSEEDYEFCDLLSCISAGDFFARENRVRPHKNLLAVEYDCMAKYSNDINTAVARSLEIAMKCQFQLLPINPIVPAFIDLRFNLINVIREKLNILSPYGCSERAIYIRQIKVEYTILVKYKFLSYFAIIYEIYLYCKNNNIPANLRGSAAGSTIIYLMGLVVCDPIKYQLSFARFINPTRMSRNALPDIDFDIASEARKDVLNYLVDRFGYDYIAHIATNSNIHARSALRDVGRALGLPRRQIEEVISFVKSSISDKRMNTLAVAAENPALQQLIQQDANICRLYKYALRFEGLARQTSLHAAGVIISYRPFSEYICTTRLASTKLQVVQYDMYDVGHFGCVKFDILGLKTLSIINDTLVQLSSIDKDRFYLAIENGFDEPEMMQALYKTSFDGLFQIDTPGMAATVEKCRPNNLSTMADVIALYRPGTMQHTDDYLSGNKGIAHYHPMLESILKETNYIILYQEQLIAIAHQVAGYSLFGADLLRSYVDKKVRTALEAEESIFCTGCINNGVSPAHAKILFDQVIQWGGYGFNKSHAISYSNIIMQTIWLKHNFPLEFILACISHKPHDDLPLYLGDLVCRGIQVKPADVNDSDMRPKIAIDQNKTKYLQLGFDNIKGFPALYGEVICKYRADGYKNIHDFYTRTKLTQANARACLLKSGVLNLLGGDTNTISNDSFFNIVLEPSIKEDKKPTTIRQIILNEHEVYGMGLSYSSYLTSDPNNFTLQFPYKPVKSFFSVRFPNYSSKYTIIVTIYHTAQVFDFHKRINSGFHIVVSDGTGVLSLIIKDKELRKQLSKLPLLSNIALDLICNPRQYAYPIIYPISFTLLNSLEIF
jgi:DNA polymerase-3 subunit alpha